MIPQEARVFTHLDATLNLSLGQILNQQWIELSAIAADDTGTIAQQLVRPRRTYGSAASAPSSALLRLPDAVDGDKIEANFKNGVISVILPKSADAQKAKKDLP